MPHGVTGTDGRFHEIIQIYELGNVLLGYFSVNIWSNVFDSSSNLETNHSKMNITFSPTKPTIPRRVLVASNRMNPLTRIRNAWKGVRCDRVFTEDEVLKASCRWCRDGVPVKSQKCHLSGMFEHQVTTNGNNWILGNVACEATEFRRNVQ